MPDLLTGNLGVSYLQWVTGGRKGPEPETWTPAYLQDLRRAGVTGVEDYITFSALEPVQDHPDWHAYRLEYDRVRAAGMRFGVYPWLHFPPKWFVDSPEYVPYVCLEHGQPTYSTSIWAPGTLALYDRFYGQLRQEFGDGVSDIHVGMPADYGEVGFPAGMSSWIVPQQHAHRGFWCGDRYARADFRAKMQGQYHDLTVLNHAWGAHFASWAALDYPPLLPPQEDAAGPRRRWLDFVSWYADSQTEFTRKAVVLVRKHFPHTPLQIKMGYGAENVEYGLDITALVKMAAQDHVIVRSTHGSLPAFFYKRFSTPSHFYGARLLTEPPNDVNRNAEVTRLFNDSTNGSTVYFDYPQNILAARDILKAYLPWVQGERAHIPVALLFPTSDLRLRPGAAEPQRLFDGGAALRDLTDYDLVDENLVQDGVLRQYRLLALFEGTWLEQNTLDRIAEWVRGGGTLVLANSGPIHNIEGQTGAYDSLVGGLASRAGDTSFFVPGGPIPPRMTLPMGGPDEGSFLGDGWWGPEPGGGATRRWSKARASLRAPVDPTQDLVITVYASQTQHVPSPHLLVNGQEAGELRFENGSASAAVPKTLLQGKPLVLLTLASATWRPSKIIPGNPDDRDLGIWVERVEVAQASAGNAPAQPLPGLHMDLPRLKRECSRRVGQGRVVFFPLESDKPAYRELIGHLIYDDGPPLQPRVDTTADGVQAAVLESHLLFLNPTDTPVNKRVSLRPSEFTGLPGPIPPALEITLHLPPHSIQAIRRRDGAVLAPGTDIDQK